MKTVPTIIRQLSTLQDFELFLLCLESFKKILNETAKIVTTTWDKMSWQ